MQQSELVVISRHRFSLQLRAVALLSTIVLTTLSCGGACSMATVESSICRICTNHCAIKVTIEDGVVVRVQGDRANPIYRGYSCVKGRSQFEYLRHDGRLLHSLKRADD